MLLSNVKIVPAGEPQLPVATAWLVGRDWIDARTLPGSWRTCAFVRTGRNHTGDQDPDCGERRRVRDRVVRARDHAVLRPAGRGCDRRTATLAAGHLHV